MYIIIAILFSALLFGCKGGGGVESSRGANAPLDQNSNLPIRWDSNKLPLTINISSDFIFPPADIDGAGRNPIEQMQKQWDDALPGKSLFNYPAIPIAGKGMASLDSYRDAHFGVYFSDDWFTGVSSDALAITQFYALKKSSAWGDYYALTHTDIIVNNRDFDFSTNAASTTNYDLHTVILHELGHLLGLGHQFDYSISAVMRPYLGISDSKRSLTSDDENRIVDLYNPGAVALGASNFFLGSSVKKSNIPDGTEYHGVIELLASGECRHFRNGVLIKSHF